MKTIIHVQTARVYGLNPDLTPKIERATIKLEDGYSYKNFLEHMHLKGYLDREKPKVIKVITRANGSKEWKEVSTEKHQALLQEAVNRTKIVKKIDYKEAFEAEKLRNDSILERLEKLEGGDSDEGAEDETGYKALYEAEKAEKEKLLRTIKPEVTPLAVVEGEPEQEGEQEGVIEIDLEHLATKKVAEIKEIAHQISDKIDLTQNKPELIASIKKHLEEQE